MEDGRGEQAAEVVIVSFLFKTLFFSPFHCVKKSKSKNKDQTDHWAPVLSVL